ncbi:hypothetical protein PG997_009441 [Apiospora hydei]|uniref:Uncharacterized protein n=1 Tax=Apiospora hydei TaxID=1337664 RepID=A0ABR1VY55_9PEZI
MTSDDMGKVPALCVPNGPFLTNYTVCVTCGEENAHNGNGNSGGGGWGPWGSWGPPPSTNAAADNTTSPGYLNPVFGPYLGYCNVSDVHVVYTITATSTEGGATSSVTPTVVTTDITLAHDFTATAKTNPADTVTPAPGPSPTSTPAPGATGATNSGGDRAWIAGPIVGAILGTALVVLSVVFVMYYRRRKKRRTEDDAEGRNNNTAPDTGPEVDTQENQQSSQWKHELAAQQLEKAQLHSDSIAPRATPHELEGKGGASPERAVDRTYAELAGNYNDHGHTNTTANAHGWSPHELAAGDRERMGVIGNRSELA